ncbi:MAG TPA: HDIG domain-containing protein [Anaerolineae bacterium]
MNSSVDERSGARRGWEQIVQGSLLWLFTLALALGLTLILSFNLVLPSDVTATPGQPAPDDIFAPRSVTYTSDVLTREERELARNAVAEQYTPLDLSIGRAQLNQARAVFAFIDVVRNDAQATMETKLSYLRAIEGLNIEEEVGLNLLNLSTAEYEVVKRDSLDIIDRLMRQEIRESQIRDYRRVATREASLDLTLAQNSVVTSLAPQFILPTIFPDEESTARQREEAVAAVEPVSRTITKDERIVRAGEIVTEADVEALTQLGLLQREVDWRDVASRFIAALLATVLLVLYWQQFQSKQRDNGRFLAALVGLILVFTLAGRFMIGTPGVLAYWFPIAALSMLLAVIFDVRLSLLTTVIVAVLLGYIAPNSLELAVYMAAGGLLAALTLRDVQRINAFFRAGLVAAVGHIAAILIFRLGQNGDAVALLQLMLYGLANGILSAALTLVGFFIMGSLFGMTTTLQLQELSRLDHPLLQELLRRAPGTYHHSIMVANLAEQAAEPIKANSALIRVGAFYHDTGKMNRPPFFVENQEGTNPHDALDPYSSARIIIGHVSDGLELARRYGLPNRIRDFIAEHHGDRLVKGFYLKAKEQAGEDADEVDIEAFRHKGPRPRSPETGIVMLADAVEATSSALRPNSEKAIEKLVNSIIDEHLTEGQLDNSGLTLGDIRQIRESFIKTLKGRFHVRARYPGNEELMGEQEPDGEVVTESAPARSRVLTEDISG